MVSHGVNGYIGCLERLKRTIAEIANTDCADMLPQCYATKLLVLEKMLNEIDLHESSDLVKFCFFHYLDAIGGVIHFTKEVNEDLLNCHFERFNQLLIKIDKNPKLIQIMLGEIKEFYSEKSTAYFPVDPVFQPVILGRLISWMHDFSEIEKIKILRYLPCQGVILHFVGLQLDSIVLKIRQLIVANNNQAAHSLIKNATITFEDYCIKQRDKYLIGDRDSLNALLALFLRVIQIGLLDPDQSIDNKADKLRVLTNTFEKILIEGGFVHAIQLLKSLMAIKAPNETDNEYIHRIAAAGYLTQHFNFSDLDSFEDPSLQACALEYDSLILTENEITQRNQIISSYEYGYLMYLRQDTFFQNFIATTKRIDDQKSFDFLRQAERAILSGTDVFAEEIIASSINTAIKYLFDSLEKEFADKPLIMQPALDAEDIAYQQLLERLSVFLSNFASAHLSYQQYYVELLRFNKVNPAQRFFFEHMLNGLFAPISAAETRDHYLDRLSLLVVMQETADFEFKSPISNWVNLITAQHAFDRAPDGRRLPQADLELEYDSQMTAKPAQFFNDFVKNKPHAHLQAISRVFTVLMKLFEKQDKFDNDKFTEVFVSLAKQCLLASSNLQERPANPGVYEIYKIFFKNSYCPKLVKLRILEGVSVEQMEELVICGFDWLTDLLMSCFARDREIPSEILERLIAALIKQDKHREVIKALLETYNDVEKRIVHLQFHRFCSMIFKQMARSEVNIDCLLNVVRLAIEYCAFTYFSTSYDNFNSFINGDKGNVYYKENVLFTKGDTILPYLLDDFQTIPDSIIAELFHC